MTAYDLLAPQLSGGKDSAVMMAVFMEAAQAAGVDDRVISYHASLAVLEWPPVVFDGIRYPGVSELAALQSTTFGVPADRHVEVTRTMPGPDGTQMPHADGTAHNWHKLNGGDRASYVASRLKASQAPKGPE
ncbi:hypothetical protein ACFWAN_31015 [Streptomyces mirabilis]|uniref:hypothetical protein n=1 Tax=Streptomyces mirabilis TaxID=68239 RepID=UPI003660AC1D